MLVEVLRGLAVLGMLVSVYALRVKWLLRSRKDYTPLCDLGRNVSCSRAFSSKTSEVFFLPNAWYGLLFYVLVFVLSYTPVVELIRILSSVAVVCSVYLGYVSFVRMRNYCVVCTITYIINLALFTVSLYL